MVMRTAAILIAAVRNVKLDATMHSTISSLAINRINRLHCSLGLSLGRRMYSTVAALDVRRFGWQLK